MLLQCQRELFDIPTEVVYLNCAYMSPLLRAVREAGQAAVARKSQPWKIHSSDFFEESEIARGLFASLIGAEADGVAIVPSVSYGISVAAANLRIAPEQQIVVLDEQFPSNVYPWHALAKRSGAALIPVSRPLDDDWTSVLERHIDERTAVVAVPNCHWTDGGLVDLKRIGRRTHEVGASLVVDATQSLGAYPLDVSEVKPDFLVSATYKWLLGPYSMGFLYVAEQHREGTPIEFTWLGREGSEDFTQLVHYRDAFQPGARRFDMGERSNFALLPMVITALRQILAWDVQSIADTLGKLTASIERSGMALGMMATPTDRRVSHMIGLYMNRALPTDLAARLAAANIFVSQRGQSIRVSPHLYNTPEDIQRFSAALAEIM